MNVDWLAKLPAPARRALYFGAQAVIGSRIGATWQEFLAWESFSPNELQQAVDQKLERLLSAAANSEYYRKLGVIRRAGESATDWLRRFPTLNRAVLRENFSMLVTDSLRDEITSPESVSTKRYDWLVVKTGGTTGEPTTVIHDAATRDWGRATRLYALRQCGFKLGTPYFRLWGSEQDLLNQQASLQQRVMRALQTEIPLNAFKAREVDLRAHHAAMLARPRVRHLMTYVDAAASLALFIREQNLPPLKFQTIMACAGTVTTEFRQILTETFGAQVFDKYGSRECSDLACECHRHNGLHVFSPHAFVEILDDDNLPCPPGQVGRIVVTMLNNLSFQMIRYEIGDLGAWAEPGACGCGSPFPRLASLQGRADDMLVTQDGTLQSSVFVRHFVGVSLNRQLIRQWQLEQTGRTKFIFRYAPANETGLAENLQKLKESFLLVFGKSADIELRRIEEIPPTATGKIRWIINSYRNVR